MSVTLTSAPPNFTEIPVNWRVPGARMEVKAAVNQNAVMPFPAKTLILGYMYSLSSPGAVVRITSAAQAADLFGSASQLASMCAQYLKVNPYTPLYAGALYSATGTVTATATIAITGTATLAGVLVFRVGGYALEVAVNAGDSGGVVCGALSGLLMTFVDPDAPAIGLPVCMSGVSSDGQTLTVQSRVPGAGGNQIDIRVDTSGGNTIPSGLTVTITPMSGGATDSDLAPALASLSDWYTDIICPWTDSTNLAALQAYLAQSYGAMQQRDAQAYVALDATYGNALKFTPNCQFISALPIQNSLTPPWIVAAAFGAASCYQTAAQPALQLKNVPLPGVVAPADADRFTPDERQQLLLAGLSTFTVDDSGAVILERVTTTCRTDASGNATNAYFDISSTKVPTRVRYDWDAYVGELYPRNQLCDDSTLAAQYNPNAVTPQRLLASWTSRCTVYEKNGWIQNSAQTAKTSSFNIDPNDGNRVNARQPIQIMGNLMVLAGSLQFISNN